MRLPRARLTTRRLMLLVALAGLALGGSNLHRRREYALARMNYHQAELFKEQNSLSDRLDRLAAERIGWTLDILPARAAQLAERNRAVGFRLNLANKWRAAARRPWLPFEDDPFEPE